MIVRVPQGALRAGASHMKWKKNRVLFFPHLPRAFLMRYYELGQTTGHVFRVLGSDGTNRWVGQTDETDHLWMCGISSNVPPLLVCCIDSFKSGLLEGGRGGYWLVQSRGGYMTMGCSLLLLCKLVYFGILRNPFYGCFLKSDFERMHFCCRFCFVFSSGACDGNQRTGPH